MSWSDSNSSSTPVVFRPTSCMQALVLCYTAWDPTSLPYKYLRSSWGCQTGEVCVEVVIVLRVWHSKFKHVLAWAISMSLMSCRLMVNNSTNLNLSPQILNTKKGGKLSELLLTNWFLVWSFITAIVPSLFMLLFIIVMVCGLFLWKRVIISVFSLEIQLSGIVLESHWLI
jgi:hypothetical protein